MKIAPSKSDGKPTQKEIPILSLIPEEEPELDSHKKGSFKLHSNPADNTSPKYSFSMGYADGTQSIRYHIKWMSNSNKVLNGLTIASVEAKLQLMEQLCSGLILTSFMEATANSRATRWAAQRLAARDVVINGGTNAAEGQAAFRARQEAAFNGVAEPGYENDDLRAGFQSGMLHVCPYKALEKQKRFMRRKMRKPFDMKTRTYVSTCTASTTRNSSSFLHSEPIKACRWKKSSTSWSLDCPRAGSRRWIVRTTIPFNKEWPPSSTSANVWSPLKTSILRSRRSLPKQDRQVPRRRRLPLGRRLRLASPIRMATSGVSSMNRTPTTLANVPP